MTPAFDATPPLDRLPFQAVVFDLDGTLVDTAPDLAAHVNAILAELDRPPLAPEAVRPLIGAGAKTLLHNGLELTGGLPPDFDFFYARFLEAYTARPHRFGRVFEGVADTLQALRSQKKGVCTNKAQAPTDSLLQATDLARFFEVIIGGDALPVRKPHAGHLDAVLDRLGVARDQAVLVGDSATDLQTARATGVPCILVSFGYTDTPAERLGADRVIDHFSDLPAALHSLRPPPA